MLGDDGFVLDQDATDTIRSRTGRKEWDLLGRREFSTTSFSYVSHWNDQITLTKRPYTISDPINAFSAAGLWIETAIEPQLSDDAHQRSSFRRRRRCTKANPGLVGSIEGSRLFQTDYRQRSGQRRQPRESYPNALSQVERTLRMLLACGCTRVLN